MRKCIFLFLLLLFVASCTVRKNVNDFFPSDTDSVEVSDSLCLDTLSYPMSDDFEDGNMPHHLPHGKDRPSHKPDNMRGFDPSSEDDMDDNGMSRYMENNDEEGWD